MTLHHNNIMMYSVMFFFLTIIFYRPGANPCMCHEWGNENST